MTSTKLHFTKRDHNMHTCYVIGGIIYHLILEDDWYRLKISLPGESRFIDQNLYTLESGMKYAQKFQDSLQQIFKNWVEVKNCDTNPVPYSITYNTLEEAEAALELARLAAKST